MDLPVVLHFTGSDGLPDDDLLENGQVAFLWGSGIYTGIPDPHNRTIWETDTGERLAGVTHWLEFPASFGELAHGIVGGQVKL